MVVARDYGSLMAKKLRFTRIDRDGDTVGGNHARADYVDVDDIEMTGEYQLLPGLLIACVIASVISRTLHRDSIYRQHTAQHS